MTKTELRQIRHLDCLIDSKQKQIDRLRSKAKHLRATDYARDRVQSSNRGGAEDLIIKICDLEIEIEKEIDELIDRKNKARKAIDAVEDLGLRTILTLRYLEFLNWEEIAVKMNYEYRYVLKLHGKALAAMDERRHIKTLKDI